MPPIEKNIGLTSAEAAKRLQEYGPNLIEEKKQSILMRIWHWVASPMSVMFIAAGGLSVFGGHEEDAWIIGALFVMNVGVGAWHEAKADTAIEKLKAKLAVIVKAMRDGEWKEIRSADLVLGDVIRLGVGDLVPADVSFLQARNLTVNDSVVTGESLPKSKAVGESAYSGSFISTGLSLAQVTATGSRTYFGKTLTMVDPSRGRSNLEKDILSVSRFLSVISIIVMIALTGVLLAARLPISEIGTLDISLLIAGIPVALPTVMTLIISVGVMELAKKSVIVRRLSSLEDLANVNLLLSDKTGTLTENRITVAGVSLLASPLGTGWDEKTIWSIAAAAAPRTDINPLAAAVADEAEKHGASAMTVADFIPGDSERKRATVFFDHDGRRVAASLGAPQTIRELSAMEAQAAVRYDSLVSEAAKKGYRALALAVSPDGSEAKMLPLAVFFLADEIRPEAKETIGFMTDHGVSVKMVTGDGYDVAVQVASELGLSGRIVKRSELDRDPEGVRSGFSGVAGFAEVMPKDKYDIVTLAKRDFVTAVTGDGVNDVPPVKAATVGIAVSNAVDALKGAADIVLSSSGIAVIKDAIIEARKIFVRLYNYSVYRISESFRLIVTIAVIGFIFHTYPLSPVQIILIALLNDIPIITLAYDRVTVPQAPASIDARRRFTLSTIFGFVGIANSMFLLWFAVAVLHAPWAAVQTLFFLKLTVSGHMLIYIAHTEKPWYKFLPSKQVILATSLTQLIATAMSVFGLFTAPISIGYAALVWGWSFAWMQVGEGAKRLYNGR
ncbi:plasma-membrane proton-efflux P-type ATPase [Patescibacteria group bacterium]|nr:plasma-membrane proton-efflux P-type ATPase [Patescibacteria group bacterium]